MPVPAISTGPVAISPANFRRVRLPVRSDRVIVTQSLLGMGPFGVSALFELVDFRLHTAGTDDVACSELESASGGHSCDHDAAPLIRCGLGFVGTWPATAHKFRTRTQK